jgi:hypothetical protein
VVYCLGFVVCCLGFVVWGLVFVVPLRGCKISDLGLVIMTFGVCWCASRVCGLVFGCLWFVVLLRGYKIYDLRQCAAGVGL